MPIMPSLAEQLAELTNPNPNSIDPEDDIYEETKAKLVDKDELDGVDERQNVDLGNIRMQSLEGMGIAYQGKIVSRNEAMSKDDFSDEHRGDMPIAAKKVIVDSPNEDDDASIDGEDDEIESDLNEQDAMDEEIDSDEAMGDEGLKIFKKRSETDSQSKEKATRNQISLWESILETRIKCQKMLTITNRLPQHTTFKMFEEQLGSSLQDVDKVVSDLLAKWSKLETEIIRQNSQLRPVLESGSACNLNKRKSSTSLEDLDDMIQKRFTNVRTSRNKILRLWYDKTRLTSSTANSKSFTGFERSTVAQIEDLLQDRERLMKRTQLKRSEYRVLGTAPKDQDEIEDFGNERAKHSSHLKEFDEEIFDDDDFYHQLLRQLIEQKACVNSGASDPIELTRQWLKIQRLRSKSRKNVDTKASKGRKIRYEIHKKLVSFMAPDDKSSVGHDARNQLFRSLFGKVTNSEQEEQLLFVK